MDGAIVWNDSYQKIIENQIDRVRLKGIATKILQHMARIRNVSDQSQARRWVMELLQNAQDVSYSGQQVRVRIRLEEDKLSFSHNGRPFQVKDILSIINQVSSKDPNGENVGKFGTGFVTTFQLSERVQVDSLLHEEGLPYKPFSVTLDRSGNEEEEILDAIVRSMQELCRVDGEPGAVEPEQDNYNTQFTYHLINEESKKAALTGMEDLQHSVYFVLLFSGRLGEITLEYRTEQRRETICYRRLEDHAWEGDLRRLDFVTTRESLGADRSTEEHKNSLIYLREGEVTLAAGWQEEAGFLPLSRFTPRLFMKFPLIGAEDFCFPVVINCNKFLVNEPRSGITLVDNPASKDAPVNKEYMTQAVELYKSFLRQAEQRERRGLANILWIPAWTEDRELSEPWVKKNIYKALYRGIADTPILLSQGRRLRLNQTDVCLLQESDPMSRRELQRLFLSVPGVILPEGEEDWYSALQNYPVSEDKIWSLEKLLCRCEDLLPAVKERAEICGGDAIDWLNRLCGLGLGAPKTALQIRTGQIRILPNQSDWAEGKLHLVSELQRDPGIPEILKDVSECLDLLDSQEQEAPLRIRTRLLHSAFHNLEIAEMGIYETSKLENYINRRSGSDYRVANYGSRASMYKEAWKKAWLLLLSCGPDEEMYRLSETFYGEELPAYSGCPENWRSSMWRPCYASVLDQLTDYVAKCESLGNLAACYFQGEQEAVEWLNRLIPKGQEYLREFSYKGIFPDQEGKLRGFQWVRADGTPDDSLKEIARAFQDQDRDCNFYGKVLDRRIDAEKLCPGILKEEEVALVLNRTLQQILANQLLGDTPMEYQVACSRLLTWMDGHPDQTERFFPAFASETEKVKLMTPAAVVELQKESHRIEQMLHELGVGSLDQLQSYIASLEENRSGWPQGERFGWYFSDDGDVLYDEELLALSEAERGRILREIGIAGEKYAFQRVKEYCLAHGGSVIGESDREIMLTMPEDGLVRITCGDYGSYHQSGWDICADVSGVTYFMEVKTHTLSSSVFDQIALSVEQMRTACREREHYIVLHVAYDKSTGQGVSCRAFMDPVGSFGAGELSCSADRYVFSF